MRRSGVVALVFAMTLFLDFGARTASALICCSVCDQNPHNPACRVGCSQSCAIGEGPAALDTVGEDDVAHVCHAVTAGDGRLVEGSARAAVADQTRTNYPRAEGRTPPCVASCAVPVAAWAIGFVRTVLPRQWPHNEDQSWLAGERP